MFECLRQFGVSSIKQFIADYGVHLKARFYYYCCVVSVKLRLEQHPAIREILRSCFMHQYFASEKTHFWAEIFLDSQASSSETRFQSNLNLLAAFCQEPDFCQGV